ncbi:MAG: UDP-N-acetylmuramoylalanine--D-glutamate ligase [Parvicellaceae bacterium]|jgi:UDP-N-acetylmuramoylalanine--D-glutamate ligase
MKEQIKNKTLKEQLLEARNKSMSLFGDIAHRLESYVEIDGVEYINDSKSTDLDSTYYSLELISKPIVWIVGSTDIENDYAIFEKLVKFKVKSIICFGKPETRIKYSFASMVDMYAHKETIAEATELARELSKSGDAVLFSPGCSSYEQFADFRDRGNQFKLEVDRLK